MKKIIQRNPFQHTEVKRIFFFLVMDVLSIAVAFYLASFLLGLPSQVGSFVLLYVSVNVLIFSLFKLYNITWRYVSIKDLYNVFRAHFVSCVTLLILFRTLSANRVAVPYPVLFFFLQAAFSFLFVSTVRVAKRLYLEVLKNKHKGDGLRTIILGAGHTGEMILRDMARHYYKHFYPIGFLDDDRSKIGAFVHGIKVLAPLAQFERVLADEQIEAVIIAMPALNFPQLKAIYSSIKRYPGVKVVKTVPRIYDYDVPDFRLKDLEEISIEDLIGRQTVEVDRTIIKGFLEEKVVLITGAGGSIGSEIAVQVCSYHPEKVIFFDIDETELHHLSLKLKKKFPYIFAKLHFVVGDVRDAKRLEEVFQLFLPQVVFHAAAYKHVPMMESNAREAVKVNVLGTYNLANTAARFAVDKFILISTDKAVRPTSVMGATKRVAEQVCKAVGSQPDVKTQFVSVRFGNVLGSRGSALPLFMEQIRSGGPITVTHPEMKRYFMTIPEAVSLVLQASAVGVGNEVMVLDMGEPVMIVKLAEDLIRLQGLQPYKDIDIEFVGLRPGEKLFEEILTAEEGTIATKHNRVFVARENQQYFLSEVELVLQEMKQTFDLTPNVGEAQVKHLLRNYITHYDSSTENVAQWLPSPHSLN